MSVRECRILGGATKNPCNQLDYRGFVFAGGRVRDGFRENK